MVSEIRGTSLCGDPASEVVAADIVIREGCRDVLDPLGKCLSRNLLTGLVELREVDRGDGTVLAVLDGSAELSSGQNRENPERTTSKMTAAEAVRALNIRWGYTTDK